jgi:signal transduction histidine kinase
VKSKEGEGTVFTIQLPLAPAVSDETHFHREEMKK